MRPMMIRTAAPNVPAVARETVWAHLNSILIESGSPAVIEPADATYIDTLIAAAVDRLDGPFGLLNRALISQSWKALYSTFPTEIPVPLARCISLDSITYLDTAGATQALASSAFRVRGLGTDTAIVLPAIGTSWPTTLEDPEAVTVTITSGFGDDVSDVPASITQALLEMIATAYALREHTITGTIVSQIPGSVMSAVTDWTVYG